MKIDIKGVIVANDDKWVYDWFDMDAVAPREVLTALDRAPNERADVYINSPGGSVFAGGEIYDALRAHPGGVQIHVTGHAASAASMIMCAGPCDISPTALVMSQKYSEEYYALKAELAELQEKLSVEERKARNHRLCKRGGFMESLVPELITMPDEDAKAFLRLALTSEPAQEFLKKRAGDGNVE